MSAFRITEEAEFYSALESNLYIMSSIKYSVPLHCHEFYEFFLVTKGRCIHKINNRVQKLDEGTLVFIRPDDTHAFDYDGEEDCEILNLSFRQKVIAAVLDYLGAGIPKRLIYQTMPTITHLSQAEIIEFSADFERMKVLSILDRRQANFQIRGLLIKIVTQYFTVKYGTVPQNLPMWLEGLLTQMQRKENFTDGLNKLYALSGRSAGHINRAFRKYLKTTPTAYINQIRLNFAKSLLVNSDMSIVEVSLEAGFESLSHFYHLFKLRYNVTPADLRNGKA